jgi:hypothetical protein
MNESNYAYELSRLTTHIDELEWLIAKLEVKIESLVCYNETIKIAIPKTGRKFPGDPMIYDIVPTIIKRGEEVNE